MNEDVNHIYIQTFQKPWQCETSPIVWILGLIYALSSLIGQVQDNDKSLKY